MKRTLLLAVFVTVLIAGTGGPQSGVGASRRAPADPVNGPAQLGVYPAPLAARAIAAAAEGVCGDLTGDGVVNVFDAITTLQISVGLIQPTATQAVLGDLNRDLAINVFDAITVLQISVGLITVDQCGPIILGPTIDLLASSDSGQSDTDNVTSDTTPTLSVSAETGDLVRLFVDGQLLGEQTATSPVEFTPTTPLADGPHDNLKQALQRHQPRYSAELIRHDCHLLPTLT